MVGIDLFDIVVVPFPFVDKPVSKKRPALVLSNIDFNAAGYAILSMITTKQHPAWPGDTQITNIAACGLRSPCLVRLKLFTLDNRLILRKIGRLGETDAFQVTKYLRSFLIFNSGACSSINLPA
ncbi:MAG: type II toxin-antitoxin system PemK/MazF family toxin [Deltaproteobacteria bacterium]|nr:type II toxin-antitoxin system PemK/MazF family toxin [Deltaproteobacteria bacterium]